MPGPGERDIDKPEFLAVGLLLVGGHNILVTLEGLSVGRELADLDEPLPADLAMLERSPRTGRCGPERGTQHHRELEALGLMQGEHLDGVVVAIDTTTEQFGGLGFGIAGAGAHAGEEIAESGRRNWTAAGGTLQQLGDVFEIGEIPFAGWRGEHPTGQPSGSQRCHEPRESTFGEISGPPADLLDQFGETLVGERSDGRTVEADEPGGGGGAHEARR